MGRVFFFILLVGTGWFLLNVIGVSIDPRGVGTTIQGREVILDADQLEVRFSMVGSLRETYMLFGGDEQQRRNSVIHVTAAGLPEVISREPSLTFAASANALPEIR